ncbi:ATP-binding protein [Streptomyces fragilis]|uniref:ATP-binding protein n=1 Tax=Streptomyces fragilis TaxID=67301 RepID=A0ABV2YQ13_9ACTN|nr:ATP-binding protein [Streptomyces fragilis]
MVVPLSKHTTDGTGEKTPLRYAAIWAEGAARAADARRAVRTFLTHAPRTGHPAVPPAVAMDAELATSELVTNAIRHAPGTCGMTLRMSEQELTITVWDSSTEQPTPPEADPRRVGGHGLHLVQSVSEKVVVALRATGKLITAHLPVAPLGGGGPAFPSAVPH